ncbi:hypothetical protein PR048_029737 [Dryococelus australis]|uniref:Uncharacterized protein n=1 Tax=Dryococelus australis TaxID=614101 RepID=A0ABQ9GE81_9NEOP|nr:hypothetical protein PR048_029737 [Dryococelus australis]
MHLRKSDYPAVRAYIYNNAGTNQTSTAVQNKQIIIVADESNHQQFFWKVLFRITSATAAQEVYLASCSFSNKANGTTCSQAIHQTLKYNVSYDNVVGLFSARYMGTCFAALKTILGEKLIHFQCWEHKISLIGDFYLKEFEKLNTLVSKMKIAGLHSRKIKNAYIAYLNIIQSYLQSCFLPTPVLTRWNSWFTSFTNSSSVINDIFKNLHLGQKLKIQIKFVGEKCGTMKTLITDLESSAYAYAHELWDELVTLHSGPRNADGAFPQGTLKLLNEYSTLTRKEKVKSQLRSYMQTFLQTLANHVSGTEANLVYQGALVNPATAGQNSEQNRKTRILDTFAECYSYSHKQLSSNLGKGNKVDVIQFLLTVKIKSTTSQHIGSSKQRQAKRFFSKYNLVVTDRWNRVRQQTVDTSSILSFNSIDGF